MTDRPTETFALAGRSKRLIRVCAFVYALAVLFVIWAFFLAGPAEPEQRVADYILIIFFGGVGVIVYREVKRLPLTAVTVDDEGLWPAHTTKQAGLIKWDTIVALKERFRSQRVDLLNDRGEILIGLEYQLSGFDRLRVLVLERMSKDQFQLGLPLTFAKPRRHHVFGIGGPAAWGVLFCYLGTINPIFGYGLGSVVGGAMLYEYLTSPFRITLNIDRVQLASPVTERTVLISDVWALAIDQGGVRLFVNRARRPVPLSGFGKNGQLFLALRRLLPDLETVGRYFVRA